MLDRTWPIAALVAGLTVLALACGGDDTSSSGGPSSTTSSSTTSTTSTTTIAAVPSTTGTAVLDVEIDASSFRNLNDMTPVRGFFVDNLLGDLDATVAVATSATGGVYPVGSLVQLFPGEAMVKRADGFDPGSNNWEFFELDVDGEGTQIRVRGGAEVVNRFGGSCATCHAQAAPEWDFVCEQDHGCDPLPIGRDLIEGLQLADPRPRD